MIIEWDYTKELMQVYQRMVLYNKLEDGELFSNILNDVMEYYDITKTDYIKYKKMLYNWLVKNNYIIGE